MKPTTTRIQNLFMPIFALLAIAVLFSLASFAQSTSGNLVGTVLDASGAAVPNATITALNVNTGVKATANTNQSGEYRVGNLAVGAYDITSSAAGFSGSPLKGVVIELNKTATANITMQIGSLTTTVEVMDAAIVIDTTTAQVQNTFETRQAADLPTASIGLGV